MGGSVIRIKYRGLIRTGLALFVIVGVLQTFWCPWSIHWLGHKAYAAHSAQQYDEALRRYSQIIFLSPNNDWAYLNRSLVYQALGQPDLAKADSEKAQSINPAARASQAEDSDEN